MRGLKKLNFRISIFQHDCKKTTYKFIHFSLIDANFYHLKCNRCKKIVGKLSVYDGPVNALKAQELLMDKCGVSFDAY